MTLEMSELGEAYLEENYREFFGSLAEAILVDKGYKVVERDSGRIKLVKGDIEAWIWPGATELEFCAPTPRNQQTEQLEEELREVMYIEKIMCDEQGFYLIGTFSVDKELDDNLANAIGAIEKFLEEGRS